MNFSGMPPRTALLLVLTGLVLTSCPPLHSLPASRTPLLYQVQAERWPIGFNNAFSTDEHLVYFSDVAVTAFDPLEKSFTWTNEFPYAIVPEYRPDSNELYVWPKRPLGDDPFAEPLTVTVLEADSGEVLRELSLDLPDPVLTRWQPRYVTHEGSAVYAGIDRGTIVQLQENSDRIDFTQTIDIAEVREVSNYAEDPRAFGVIKIVPDPESDDLYALVTNDVGFEGINHVYRIGASGATRWGAAPYVQPQDVLLLGGRVVYFDSVGAVLLGPASGEERQRVTIPQGECVTGPAELHPVRYDPAAHRVYAPHGALQTAPTYTWLWSVFDLVKRMDVEECTVPPASDGETAYLGGHGFLLTVGANDGHVLSFDSRSRSGYSLRFNAPTFVIGSRVVVVYQDDWRMMMAVYQAIE